MLLFRRSLSLGALLSVLAMALAIPAQAGAQTLTEDQLSVFNYRSIGPTRQSGRFVDFAVPLQQPGTYYAAAASGHLWKTVNHGISWEIFSKYLDPDKGGLTAEMLRLKEEGGVIDKRDSPRINNDQIGALLDRSNDLITYDRMSFCRVRSGDEDAVRVPHLADGVCHCAAAEGLHEACYCAAVSKPGAVIDDIGSDHCAHKFLEQIILFVGTSSRGQTHDGIRAMVLDDISQLR